MVSPDEDNELCGNKGTIIDTLSSSTGNMEDSVVGSVVGGSVVVVGGGGAAVVVGVGVGVGVVVVVGGCVVVASVAVSVVVSVVIASVVVVVVIVVVVVFSVVAVVVAVAGIVITWYSTEKPLYPKVSLGEPKYRRLICFCRLVKLTGVSKFSHILLIEIPLASESMPPICKQFERLK